MKHNNTSSPDWNAEDYARNSQGQFGWAMQNLTKLHLAGNESVLDIGCGDGKISLQLAKLVPNGDVLGIDQSAAMISLACATFRESNLSFRVLDAQSLDFEERFDAIFSNSAIHWMPDASAVVGGIARALKPGGRIFLSMGGRGTAAAVFQGLASLRTNPRWVKALAGVSSPHYFRGPEDYRPWLEDAGLVADRLELVSKPMLLADLPALEGWLRTTWTAYWRSIPEIERPDFLKCWTEKVAGGCAISPGGGLSMSMVNLEVAAHKPDKSPGRKA